MTRGRDGNHAYVVVEDNLTAHDVLAQAITRDWIDQPAVVRKAQLDPRHTRQRDPAVLAEEDEFDKLERRITSSSKNAGEFESKKPSAQQVTVRSWTSTDVSPRSSARRAFVR